MTAPTTRPPARRALARWGAAAVAGVALAAWGVATITPVLYVAGCVLVALTAAAVARALTRRHTPRWSVLVGGAVAVAVLLATVGGPWWTARGTGDEVRWSVTLRDTPDGVAAIDGAVVVAGPWGADLVDLADGAVTELVADAAVVGASDAGAGLVVLTGPDAVRLVDRAGHERWRLERFADGGPVNAVAADDGTVVVARRDPDDGSGTVQALAPDGSALWSREGATYNPGLDVPAPGAPGRLELPTVALVRLAGDEDVTAMDARTGSVLPSPVGHRPMAAAGSTVLWTTPAADPSRAARCRATAVTGDAEQWSASVPCVDRVVHTDTERVVYRLTGTADPDEERTASGATRSPSSPST
ncbi:hypothetical protein [Cellulomonas sp. ATA003]|uniref:hypothetical protein n=1 Tax=Cellulomonas sp. ATA003 TaxID=3073064 RepID=UPI002873639E|nr:hypothetical protein [Cellulomonas sp. ATA003]WNB86530.1 hypothetical protein REH70_04660 [Cellulomonas sp. ATA003]